MWVSCTPYLKPVLLLLLLVVCLTDGSHGLGVSAAEVSVAAYLPEWRYEGANWEYICSKVTHLILFSLEPTPDGDIAHWDRLPRPLLMEEARQAARRHGTRLMVCFGGNGRSGGFSGMVRSARARERFVRSVVQLCEAQGLDGVDYNWEYPG